ncbi:MAG: tetratricopeptide repeat protein [Coriobacteriia bacterium]|nr:tetratricopeptide repeat protein [Coriobacteriia bacterium]
MNKIVILDTNVLLADPNSVLSFPRAEVVIPETVLSELDKLKTARVDPDLRFRGREVSRILFELSEDGSLVEGIDLPDGGSVRVMPFDSETKNLPEGVSTRNSDDRILVSALQVFRACDAADCDVRLVTNDLNMLLKAQTLGLPVERYGDGVEAGFSKRYIIRPFQRYRVPITILAVAIAVFVGVLFIAMYSQQDHANGTMPTEFKTLLTSNQLAALDALGTLQANPNDSEALLKMANIFFDQSEAAMQSDAGTAITFGEQGIRYYERYLAVSPGDSNARADLATLYFNTGQTDRAIREVGSVLQADGSHLRANYNLGIFYAQGRRDYAAAETQFKKVISLTKNDSNQHALFQQATLLLEQVRKLTTNQSVDASGAKQ